MSDASQRRYRLLVVVFICLFVLLHTFIFPRKLGQEFHLTPVKVIALDTPISQKLTPGGSFFCLGSVEGYWGPDLELEYVHSLRENFHATRQKMAFYNAEHEQVEVQDVSGKTLSLPGERYPYWLSQRLFLFEENRLGLSEYDDHGKLLWSRKVSSLITCLDAGKNLLVVGTLDGRLQFFDRLGQLKEEFIPGGSRLSVIYNVQISRDENKVLALSGIDPKRLILLQKKETGFRPVFHQAVNEKSREPTPLGFLDEGRWGYCDSDDGLLILDTQDHQERLLVLDGRLEELMVSRQGNLLTLISKNNDHSQLRICSIEGGAVFQAAFQAKEVFLAQQSQKMILGMDNVLLVISRGLQ